MIIAGHPIMFTKTWYKGIYSSRHTCNASPIPPYWRKLYGVPITLFRKSPL